MAGEAAPTIVGGLFAVAATYWSQRAIVDYQRGRDDLAQAWDQLLKPLYDAVWAVRWHSVSRHLGFDEAYVYANRWDDVSAASRLLHDVSTHRLASRISIEIGVVKQWVDAEASAAARWNQAMTKRGYAGRALFAYLVPDTSRASGGFDGRVAHVMLGVVGIPAAAEHLSQRAVELSKNDEVWEEARVAAREYRAAATRAEDSHREAVAALETALKRGP